MPANRQSCPGRRPALPGGGPVPATDGAAPAAPAVPAAPDAEWRSPGTGRATPAPGPGDDGPWREWRLTLPGAPGLVCVARRFARAVLRDRPRTDDVELVVSELVTNAIRHTPSGAAGAVVSLRIAIRPGWARVEVGDLGDQDGTEWHRAPLPGADREYGRGLAIVRALADRAGRDPSADGQISWAEFTWETPADRPGARRRPPPRMT